MSISAKLLASARERAGRPEWGQQKQQPSAPAALVQLESGREVTVGALSSPSLWGAKAKGKNKEGCMPMQVAPDLPVFL